MTSYHCAQAKLPGGIAADVRLVTADGRLTEVTVGSARPADVALPGLVVPGFANAHSHAFHRGLRGRTHAGPPGDFWSWRERMYDLAGKLTPDSYLALARATFAELALAGYTVVGEFHYLHHAPGGIRYADPNAMGLAIVQAAADAGIRLTLLDTLYLAGGLGSSGHLPLDETQQRFSDASVDAWADRWRLLADGPTLHHGVAVHSVRAVPRPALAEVASAIGPAAPVHVHLSEQAAENRAALDYYGSTPTGLLAAAGLLDQRLSVVHATHLTDADRDLLGAAGAIAVFCPTTEADLADGIGPALALAEAGVRLALGSDQHAVVDPFAELRGLEAHERLASGKRVRFVPADLFTIASANGYASLGWPDGGRLVPGGLADFVAIDLASPRTAGADAAQVGLAAAASDITDVVVGGELIVRDRRHRLGDVGALLSTAIGSLT